MAHAVETDRCSHFVHPSRSVVPAVRVGLVLQRLPSARMIVSAVMILLVYVKQGAPSMDMVHEGEG